MASIQVCLRIPFKDEGSSITMNKMRAVTGPIVIGNTVSPREIVCVPLKPANNLPRFQKLSSLLPS